MNCCLQEGLLQQVHSVLVVAQYAVGLSFICPRAKDLISDLWCWHCRSEPGSYGYCSETGQKMSASSGQQRGAEYGQAYTTGDVVGAGIIIARQEMFFT